MEHHVVGEVGRVLSLSEESMLNHPSFIFNSRQQVYMKETLAKLKAEKPNQPHKERFKEAASSWAKSPRLVASSWSLSVRAGILSLTCFLPHRSPATQTRPSKAWTTSSHCLHRPSTSPVLIRRCFLLFAARRVFRIHATPMYFSHSCIISR